MHTRSLARRLVILGLVVALAHLFDRWAYSHLEVSGILQHDGGRMLRVMGYLPLWLVVAVAYALHRQAWSVPERRREAGLLIVGPALAGLIAELLKVLIRRERPGLTDGAYVFQGFEEGFWHGSGLGLPSSHASVAFAGATALSLLFPRTAPLWLLLAAGTGWTRVAGGAHFLSDVVAGGAVGYLAARMLWSFQREPRGGGDATPSPAPT